MSTVEQQILGVLEEHVSHLTARSLLRRALDSCRVTDPAERDVPQIVGALEQGVRLFVPEREQPSVLERLGRLGGTNGGDGSHERLPIGEEGDVMKARAAGRKAVMAMGADAFTVQKVVTAVSELARNIVMYAGHGTLEVETHRSRIRIVASDEGPGIANLDDVLAGRYRSRTGLGRGLLGVKRLADDFDVDTGPQGTVVTVEFAP